MTKSPNANETEIISAINNLMKETLIDVAAYEDDNSISSFNNPYQFQAPSLPALQNMAYVVYGAIKGQGVENTCDTLVNVAKNLQKSDWNNANSVGHAFKEGVGYEPYKTVVVQTRTNPFQKMAI